MAQRVVFITSGSTYTIPSDFSSLVSVEGIGGGGAGFSSGNAGGGGGGAYAKSTTISGLSANQVVNIQVGAGGTGSVGAAGGNGTDTWWGSSVPATAGIIAKGGSGSSSATGGTGGPSASSVGTVTNSGGAGGSSGATGPKGAGGGAGGPGGVGGAGASNNTTGNGGGHGGGSGATLSAAGTAGNTGVGGGGSAGGAGGASAGQTGGSGGTTANNANATPPANGGGGGGGGGFASSLAGAGGAGTFWTQSSDSSTAGSGGGGGSCGVGTGGGGTGGAGALYGGGGGGSSSSAAGGNGAQGIIVFTYNAIESTGRLPGNSGYKFPILNSDGTASSYKVDFDDMFVQKELFLDAGLYVWGDNSSGQLGQNYVTNTYSSPITVGALTNWKQAVVGRDNTLAVKTDGTLWAWGLGSQGALGDGTIVSKSSPVQVGTLTNWNQISGGNLSQLAIKTDGTLWAWGYNGFGVLGLGNTTAYSSPVQVGALNNWKYVTMSKDSPGNSRTAFAIKTDGTLWAWGGNNSGCMGIGSSGNYYSSPVQVGNLTNWKSVVTAGTGSGGTSYPWTAAIKTDGTLWTWGSNLWGGLGNGNNTAYSSPVQIGSLTNWKQISIGSTYYSGSAPFTFIGGNMAAAVKTDGTLWTWGSNIFGALGIGSSGNYYSSPVQVGALNNWKEVSVSGGAVVYAIKTDGTLWAWGYNQAGALGINASGSTSYYSSPIQIGALNNWKSVVGGGPNHTLTAVAISSPDLP